MVSEILAVIRRPY